MRRFGKKKIVSEVRDPLRAIPLRPDGVAAVQKPDGLLVSRSVIRGGRGWLGRWFARDYAVRALLDARGRFFWEQIDGRRSLDEIAGLLERQSGLDKAAARQAIFAFTKELMRRNLVALRLDD